MKKYFLVLLLPLLFMSLRAGADELRGMPTQEVPPDTRSPNFGFFITQDPDTGALVFADAHPTSQAAYLFKEGDEFLAFEDVPLDSWKALNDVAAKAIENKAYRFRIRRGDEELTIPIVPNIRHLSRAGDVGFGFRLGFKEGKGAVITSVTPRWPGIGKFDVGDVFKRAGDKTIRDINDLVLFLNDVNADGTYRFVVERRGQEVTVDISPKAFTPHKVLRGFYEPFLPVLPPDKDVRIVAQLAEGKVDFGDPVILMVYILARHVTYFDGIVHLPSLNGENFALSTHTMGKESFLAVGEMDGLDYAQVAAIEFALTLRTTGEFEVNPGTYAICTTQNDEDVHTYVQLVTERPLPIVMGSS